MLFENLTQADILEAAVLFLLSFVIGIILGWLIWGRFRRFKRLFLDLEEKYNATLHELNDLRAQHQDLEARNRDLDLKFKDLTSRYGNLEVQHDRSLAKVKELDGNILHLREKLEQSQGKVTALEGFQVKYNELLPAYEADRQRIAELQMKINNMDAQRGELNELITSLRPFRTRFEELQVQHNRLKSEQESLLGMKGDLERTAQADLKLVATLEQQLAKSKQEVEDLKTLKGDLERTAQADLRYGAQLQQQLEASQQELETLRLSKAEWEQSASGDAGRVPELEQQLAAVRQEMEDLKQVKGDLERTAQADLKMVGGLEKRLHEAQQELKSLRQIYNELQRTAQADLSYVGRLESQLAELKRGAVLSAPVIAEPEPVAVVDDAWKEAEAALLADPRLAKIRARAGEMNFDRIGLAAPGERDDLKLIKGIGPFIEKKLNALNIYTFRQISNFTQEDVEKITEVISFFPGRIERDEWVKQAINFVDNGIPTHSIVPNDLKVVEGIGPKIEGLLHRGGIKTWAELASAQVSRIQEILDAAGDRYRIHDPSTWPYQASLADEGKWEDLERLQEELVGGRKS